MTDTTDAATQSKEGDRERRFPMQDKPPLPDEVLYDPLRDKAYTKAAPSSDEL